MHFPGDDAIDRGCGLDSRAAERTVVEGETVTERRLGRGLESLLGSNGEGEDKAVAEAGTREVSVDVIKPNPLQPRRGFREREMNELVESVKAVGVLQPVIVRRSGRGYELVAGERRLRAAKMAGLATVPIIEREASDDDLLSLALTENLQREDLNPIEKARGFKEMIDRFELTQEEAAARIGKDRSTVANFVRLLELPESVQHVVSRGTISMGHARALLGLRHASTQQALALRIEEEGLSVREVERLVAQSGDGPRTPRGKSSSRKSAHIRDIEDRARERLGTKVSIDEKAGRGKITIHFYSDDDFQRVLDILGLSS